MRFEGYAALFDLRDAGGDIIRPGAFRRAIRNAIAENAGGWPLLWQHCPEKRIGWISSMIEDDKGLHVVGAIDSPDGGAAAALKGGKVTGLSFGYRARAFTRDALGRELTDVDVFEVSLVTHPMQPGARIYTVADDDEADRRMAG